MHELGTVFYVIREVEQVVEENHLTKVASVTLEIGEVSGIIPSYIKDFWQWAIKKEKYLQDAELIIEPIKAVTRRDLLRGLQADISHGKIRKNMPAL